jgi:branched-chain amino acid transport system permease protein
MTTRFIPWIVAALIGVLIPTFANDFYLNLLNYIGINTLVALGLVLLTGAGGLTSFGQSAFMGLGAYATAVISTNFGLSPWLGLPVALLLSGVVALGLGFITLHLSGHYLALLTLAWGMIIFLLFGNIEFLGGHSGINGIPPLTFFGLSLSSNGRYYYLIWCFVALSLLGATLLLGSREGRAIRALRGGKGLVESLGINVFRVRLAIFLLAAVLCGLAGWLYAHMQRYVGPAPFDLAVGIEFLLMAVIGGAGSVIGALVGATVITSLRTVLQDILPLFTARAGNLEIVVYGCLFILMLQYARRGLVGLVASRLPAPARTVVANDARLPARQQPAKDTVLLDVQNLTKRFGGLVAVDDVSFQARAGEIVGLIGPNGAGKSTTFNLISGALAPTSGRVTFNAMELGNIRAWTLVSKGMSRTFQHVKLRPHMTLLENVMLGAYSRTSAGFIAGMLHLDQREEAIVRAEAMSQLGRVGLAERAGEFAGNLPLGQQRALEIARSLAADPILLMLDEPAAGLRQLEKKQLGDLLRSLRTSGLTLLLVEHDVEFVMGLVDRIIMLDFGRKVAEGLPHEIRNDPAVQQAYLGVVA